jgi:hypothetical protein
MEHVEALRRLAKEYSVRSPQKLKQVAEKIGAHFTLKECQQALQTSVPAQTLAPPPRSLGHSAAEGPRAVRGTRGAGARAAKVCRT